MDCSKPGFPVLHHFPEFAQTLVHWVGDAIEPSHPLLSPSPPVFNLSSIRVFSNESALCIRWPMYWSIEASASASFLPMIILTWLQHSYDCNSIANLHIEIRVTWKHSCLLNTGVAFHMKAASRNPVNTGWENEWLITLSSVAGVQINPEMEFGEHASEGSLKNTLTKGWENDGQRPSEASVFIVGEVPTLKNPFPRTPQEVESEFLIVQIIFSTVFDMCHIEQRYMPRGHHLFVLFFFFAMLHSLPIIYLLVLCWKRYKIKN